MTVVPGDASTAAVGERPEPPAGDGEVLVEGLLVGICGTDAEVTRGGYGTPPPGSDDLVLGHESLGRVLEAPAGSGLSAGDLVVGVVRRPDPVPCPWCARLEWDMCSNGLFTEHGIKGHDGYGSERWRAAPGFVVPVGGALGDLGVLVEPAAVVAKAWEQVERIGSRATYEPRTALVTGAGPVGLLAALLGVQRGLDVHVLDRVTDGPKPALVADLGATYHHEGVQAVAAAGVVPDVVIEGTGLGTLLLDCLTHLGPNGICAAVGLGSAPGTREVDLTALNKQLVLGNQVLFGSVNEAYRHYEQGARAIEAADRSWLERLVTRRVPLSAWAPALDRQPDDVKVVVDLQR